MAHKTRWLLGGLLCLALLPAFAHAQSPERMEEFRKALQKEIERKFGPDSPATAFILNRQAGHYRAQGRYAEAEPLYLRALAIWEKSLGPDLLYEALSLENYATLLRETGRQVEATKLEARAKAIRAKHAEQNPAN